MNASSKRWTVVDTPFRVVTKTLAGSASPLADLLASAETFIRRFVAFQSEHQSGAVTLSVAHFHAIEAADTTGYLHTHSAEKRSGKTRLLEVLELLVPSPIRASTISPAALFRLLDTERRTLLLDEVDAIFSPKSDREELRGLLNAGYRRGSFAWRVEVQGKSFTPTPYDAFGAKVLAGIGGLPDTIADRCIPIELRRRRRDDEVERFRYREARETGNELRAALEAWTNEDTIRTLAAARPRLPSLDDDRALEAWEPLCAIAELAGGTWPERARSAAEALHNQRPDTDVATGVATLRAIADLFGAERDRLTTVEILRGLAERDDGPWPYWFSDDLDRAEREQKAPLKAARRLSRLLEPYGIKPRDIRLPDESVSRGYLRESFADAWSRYLSAPTTTTATTATALASTVADVVDVAVPAQDQAVSEEQAIENVLATFAGTKRLEGG
jgi:hypothetical protein